MSKEPEKNDVQHIGTSTVLDPEDERRVRRKIDFVVLPMVSPVTPVHYRKTEC